MPACSLNLVAERIQRLATRLLTGMRQLPYKKRLQRLGLHSLQRRRLRADLILKALCKLIQTCYPPSRSTRPKKAPLQGTPRCEVLSKEKVGIFGEGCEILEWAPGFCRNSAFCQCFQETVGGGLDRSLSASPPLAEHSPRLFPPAHHPLTVIIYVVSSLPLWPIF